MTSLRSAQRWRRSGLVARASGAVVTLALTMGGGVGTGPAAAAWKASTSAAPAAVSAATFSSGFYATSTSTSASQTYAVGGVITGTTTYIDLVNTSSTDAQLRFGYTLTSLVAGNSIKGCLRAWSAGGTCLDTPAGTGTTIADSTVLTNGSGRYTTPTPLPAGGRLYLQVSVRGVGVSASLATVAPLKRPAQDRTGG